MRVGSQNAWDAGEGFACTGVVTAKMLKGRGEGLVFQAFRQELCALPGKGPKHLKPQAPLKNASGREQLPPPGIGCEWVLLGHSDRRFLASRLGFHGP